MLYNLDSNDVYQETGLKDRNVGYLENVESAGRNIAKLFQLVYKTTIGING